MTCDICGQPAVFRFVRYFPTVLTWSLCNEHRDRARVVVAC